MADTLQVSTPVPSVNFKVSNLNVLNDVHSDKIVVQHLDHRLQKSYVLDCARLRRLAIIGHPTSLSISNAGTCCEILLENIKLYPSFPYEDVNIIIGDFASGIIYVNNLSIHSNSKILCNVVVSDSDTALLVATDVVVTSITNQQFSFVVTNISPTVDRIENLIITVRYQVL